MDVVMAAAAATAAAEAAAVTEQQVDVTSRIAQSTPTPTIA